MPRSIRLSHRKVEAHEALMVRQGTLLDQLRPMAAKHPEAAVPPVLKDLAGQLLAEATWFGGPSGAAARPAANGAGVVAQLGEARALLEHFEAQHSMWDPGQSARVWMLRRGTVHIRRLRPFSTVPPRSEDNPEARRMRKLLEERINAITKGMAGAEDLPISARLPNTPRRLRARPEGHSLDAPRSLR